MKPRVFISYSHSDKAIANEIANKLTTGCQVYWDFGLPAGESWWDAILDRIQSSGHFIVILSKDWLDSLYCESEHNFALSTNRHIFYLNSNSKFDFSTYASPEIRSKQIITYAPNKSIQEIIQWIQLNRVATPLPDNVDELRPVVPADPLLELSDAVRSKKLNAEQIQENIDRARRLARTNRYQEKTLGLLEQLKHNYPLNKYQQEDVNEILAIYQKDTIARPISVEQMLHLVQILKEQQDVYYDLADLLADYLTQHSNSPSEIAQSFGIAEINLSIDEIVVRLIDDPELLRTILNTNQAHQKVFRDGIYSLFLNFTLTTVEKLIMTQDVRPA